LSTRTTGVKHRGMGSKVWALVKEAGTGVKVLATCQPNKNVRAGTRREDTKGRTFIKR